MGLPLSTTKVPADRSIQEIIKFLDEVGFEQTAQVRDRDDKVVFGHWRGLNFQWKINTKKVVDALLDESGETIKNWIRYGDKRGNKHIDEINRKAERIAWRVIRDQVRATVISIKYGIMEPLHGFAGYLMIEDPNGNRMDMASLLTQAASQGTLNSPDMIRPALTIDSGKK